jgi:electron transport complex protein RnfG
VNKHALKGCKIAGICLACALLVTLTHFVTRSAIKSHAARDEYRMLKSLVPAGAFGEKQDIPGNTPVRAYYPVLGKQGELESYILVLEGTGYRGPLPLIVHCEPSGEILAARLLETRESPGMGKMAESPDYMRKFTGTGAEKPVPVSKSGLSPRDADAVSGVTYTFRGIAGALERASAFVKNGGLRK